MKSRGVPRLFAFLGRRSDDRARCVAPHTGAGRSSTHATPLERHRRRRDRRAAAAARRARRHGACALGPPRQIPESCGRRRSSTRRSRRPSSVRRTSSSRSACCGCRASATSRCACASPSSTGRTSRRSCPASRRRARSHRAAFSRRDVVGRPSAIPLRLIRAGSRARRARGSVPSSRVRTERRRRAPPVPALREERDVSEVIESRRTRWRAQRPSLLGNVRSCGNVRSRGETSLLRVIWYPILLFVAGPADRHARRQARVRDLTVHARDDRLPCRGAEVRDARRARLPARAIVLCVAAVTTVLFQRLRQPVVWATSGRRDRRSARADPAGRRSGRSYGRCPSSA